MNVLIVGNGGREHALAWRISRSPSLARLWVAPGNYGTARIATNLPAGSSVSELCEAARKVSADLVVVGPEAPLADGLADRLADLGIPVFGPTQAAARLESSKSFAREVIRQAGAPGPEFAAFAEESEALDYLRRNPGPRVVKADGLAAGKGVVVCDDEAQAADAVLACMSGRAFGDAGATVLLEERLEGREVSVFALSDGEHISPLGRRLRLQAPGRRRQGAEHRRHGQLLPAAILDSRTLRRGGVHHHAPGHSRDGRAGNAVPGRVVRRADADRRRPEDTGVQLPLRRPGNTSPDAPARVRPAGADDGLQPRYAG